MAPGKALLPGAAQDQDGADEAHAHPIGKRKLLIYKDYLALNKVAWLSQGLGYRQL